MNAPTNIGTALITGGVRVTWTDNGDSSCVYEIWGSVDGGTSSMLGVRVSGVELFDHIRGRGVDMVYKVRARKNNIVSAYSLPKGVAPLTFTLTSSGTGAGVMTVRFKVSETTIATLSGAARFYTNLAGTTGESTTWTITSGALRTMYLKVPSGTATLKVKNVITTWGDIYGTNKIGWEMPSGTGWENYPYIDIDISLMVHLTKINIFGNNTIHGSISGLTGLTFTCFGNGYGGTNNGNGTSITGDISGLTSLTNLDVWDINTLSGDVSGLPLTVIWIGGNNTISGSITGMTQLTFLEARGLNTLSGSISNLTSLTTLVLGGNNTCTGSIAGLTSLTDLQIIQITGTSAINGSIAGLSTLGMLSSYGSGITGSIAGLTALYYIYLSGVSSLSGSIAALVNLNYISELSNSTLSFANVTNLTKLSFFYLPNKTLLAANVNQILADFWANKDAAKTYSSRQINMLNSAAPTGQGLTDKAALQAYRSPGNNILYDLWTVITA